jgi:hypothetical protein
VSPGAVAILRDVNIRQNEAREVMNSGGFLSGGDGGGVHIGAAAQITIIGSTVEGNTADDSGGGLRAIGSSLVLAVNSTFSGNTAPGFRGGGVDAISSATSEFVNVTIAGNEARSAGGVSSPVGTVRIVNSILADNLATGSLPGASANCSGTVDSGGYNLIEEIGACTLTGDTVGNLIDIEAGLDVLADNGGPTNTHRPLSGSPAIDAGPPLGCFFPGAGELVFDQRGRIRPQDGNGNGTAVCDIGSVEVPEPDSFVLGAAAALALWGIGLRRKSASSVAVAP